MGLTASPPFIDAERKITLSPEILLEKAVGKGAGWWFRVSGPSGIHSGSAGHGELWLAASAKSPPPLRVMESKIESQGIHKGMLGAQPLCAGLNCLGSEERGESRLGRGWDCC